MRLRTLESFWLLKNGLLHTYPSLKHNVETDIVVIGGGITGAFTSHALMERGYKVLLLDRRDIGQGSTAATTSMLQYELDVPLYKLAELIGENAAVNCYRAGIDALRQIKELVEKHQIDCGYEEKESLYIAHNRKSLSWLKKEFEIRKKYIPGVSWLTSEQLLDDYGLESAGGILSQDAGSVDAYRLAHKLIYYNSKRGMLVHDQTNVTNFSLNDGERASLLIDEKIKVDCKKVIFCSGFESTEFLKEKIAKLFYTYAAVSEQDVNVKDKLKQTLVWNTDRPYSYMRTTDDGRLLIGGEDSSLHPVSHQQKIKERKSIKLQKKLKKLIPGVEFIEDFNWGGTFGNTKDGLPYIGQSPEYKNALFVLAFGGNGICFSAQAMDIIPALLEGKDCPIAYHYRFGRN